MRKTIPIQPVATDVEASLLQTRMQRRSFLKASALLTGVLALGAPIAMLAPSRAWALELGSLNQAQADSILLLAKTLYPHRGLPDAVYALAVKDIDAKARDAVAARTIAAGVDKLAAASQGAWGTMEHAARTRLVAALQSDPFIQMVRAQCITSLYDNDMAFAHFGYEGEAFNKGGYFYRGFNDLTWLPTPPLEASPEKGV